MYCSAMQSNAVHYSAVQRCAQNNAPCLPITNRFYSSSPSVQCTVYSVQCTRCLMYKVNCAPSSSESTLNTVQLFTVELNTVHCTLYNVNCTVYTVQMYTVQVYTVQSTMYSCALSPQSDPLFQCPSNHLDQRTLAENNQKSTRGGNKLGYSLLYLADQGEARGWSANTVVVIN